MARFLRLLMALGLLLAAACPATPRRADVPPPEASASATPEPEPVPQDPHVDGRGFPAQVAGPEGRGFYSADSARLGEQVSGLLDGASASAELEGRDLVGLVVPHAGYRYSGPTAAAAYRQLRGRSYSTVVVLALCHRARAERLATLDADFYETPLGRVPIDRDLVDGLVRSAPDLLGVDERVFRGEHSLEVQLPMLQRALPGGFSLVPIVLATGEPEHAVALAALLHERLGGRPDVLFVASSDLSHFFPYEEAERLDRETLGIITGLDLQEYRRRGPRQREMPCGYHPVLALMELFSRYDAAARRATLLRYENSGDTAGDRSRVVGYGAVAFSLAAGLRGGTVLERSAFSREERRALIDLARSSAAAAVRHERLRPQPPGSPALAAPGAAFVTLTCRTDRAGRCVGPGNDLRGCIGHVVARGPLHECVAEVASSAAVRDRRFPPVSEAELLHLSYEVSVLTPPEAVRDPREVVVGRDGLIMTRGSASGLLLPQVAVEHGWDRDELLVRTCRKAGMEPACWQDPATRIERFGAIVWGESLAVEDR